ncbi:MAG TPA: mechanosensitive ion channel protein MscS, partial [Lachnospiraceae bacterium]|nr:mechanosensitive ion channel protein MscS [Lachnospiraceae bacterium]
MQKLLNKIIEVCTTAGIKILLAIVVWVAGRFLIRKLVAFLQKRDLLRKMEPTVASFVGNFIN